MLEDIKQANIIVIKIGSSLLINSKKKIREDWLKKFIEDVVELKKLGKKIILVSSGAVALGYKYICSSKRDLRLEEKQAAAACGQIKLLTRYQKFFSTHKYKVAQILLTLQDTENRRNYLNAKNTLETLLLNDIIPIINENDTVATQELRFGDNDRLAARVAQMCSADLLILLSDVDGLYTKNPRLNSNAEHLSEILEITPEIENMASGAITTGYGSGGMITKIQAAKIAVSSGCNMMIVDGSFKNPISRLENFAKYTIFRAKETPIKARKNWIVHNMAISGSVIVDDGALKAIKKGKSLLPAGVIDIEGEFSRGDIVFIKNSKLMNMAKGVVAYSFKDAKLILGRQTSEIENIIGFSGRNELIHSDDLVVI